MRLLPLVVLLLLTPVSFGRDGTPWPRLAALASSCELSIRTRGGHGAPPLQLSQLKPQQPQTNDRAIVTPRRVVIVRGARMARDFPGKKTATVTYPVISGLKDQKVLRRVQSILQIKNVFDTSLAEYREDTWLTEFAYKVNFNRKSILDITFTQDGSGAYPDTHTKHFAINLKTGTIVKASDVFEPAKLESLSALVNSKLQDELQQIMKENSGPGTDAEDTRIIKESQEVLEFKSENLDEFQVQAKGLTFLYDAGYPHAIQAFEPAGRYFFSYSELKPFIKRNGLLGQFVE
jgi:hypothetical protein